MIPLHWIAWALVGPEADDAAPRRIVPALPRVTEDGWLVWLWPLWQQTHWGYGTDSCVSHSYTLRRPEGRCVPGGPTLRGLDRLAAWATLVVGLLFAWGPHA